MDIYHKPNDTERCLPYFASHAKHCIKYIPFEMARRVCIIVENNSLSLKKKIEHLTELKKNFRTYGYCEKIVQIGIQKSLKFLKPICAKVNQFKLKVI